MAIYGRRIVQKSINELDLSKNKKDDKETGYDLPEDDKEETNVSSDPAPDEGYDLPPEEGEGDPAPEDPAPDEGEGDPAPEDPAPDEGEGDPAPDEGYDLPPEEGEGDPAPDEGEGDPAPDEGEGDAEEETNPEDEIFQDLSDNEKKIRDKHLIGLYVDLYTTLNSYMDKLNNISKNEMNIEILRFISIKSKELINILYDYIYNVYNTRTYVENYTNYYIYLASFDKINKLMEELDKKNE